MLAVMANDPDRNIELFTLVVKVPGQPDDYVLFRTEKNLLDLYPEAKWAGQSNANDRMTYTRSLITQQELDEFGQRVYENVFPEEL